MVSTADDNAEVRVRYTKGVGEMVQRGAAPRVTSRPGEASNLEQVCCRPVVRVPNLVVDQLRVLTQTGFQRKCISYQRGKRFSWGKCEVTVGQVFCAGPTPAEYTKRLLSPDWLVTATLLSTSEGMEDAAAVLLNIRDVLRDRVALFK